MKAYICDGCGETITKPHETKMKEFRLNRDMDGLRFGSKQTVTIHLCDECFHGLFCIAEGKEEKAKGENEK